MNEFVNKNLNSKFFKNNVPNQMSAYTFLDFTLSINSLDEKMNEILPEEKKKELVSENKLVEEEMSIDKLYNMLRKELSPPAVNILINKLMKDEKQVIPRLLQDLKRSGNDSFVEGAARLLIKSETNYSKEIGDILPQIKYPYTQAVMCYVLGKLGSEEIIELIYNFFISLKSNYTSEAYYEGPLLGLHEIKKRYDL